MAAQGKTNCISSLYTLNPDCLDADALAILKAYQPTENASDANFNYINNKPDTSSQIDHDYRIDHNFSPNESLTGRLMYEQVDDFAPASTWGGGQVPTINTSIFTSGLNAMVRLTSSLTPTIVNSVSAAETFDKPRLHASNAPYPTDVNIALYYPDANTTHQIPNIGVSSYDSIGVGALPVNASDGEGIINDDITVVRGKHTLQAGGFYVFGIKNQITTNTPWGSLTFDGNYTGSGASTSPQRSPTTRRTIAQPSSMSRTTGRQPPAWYSMRDCGSSTTHLIGSQVRGMTHPTSNSLPLTQPRHLWCCRMAASRPMQAAHQLPRQEPLQIFRMGWFSPAPLECLAASTIQAPCIWPPELGLRMLSRVTAVPRFMPAMG